MDDTCPVIEYLFLLHSVGAELSREANNRTSESFAMQNESIDSRISNDTRSLKAKCN